MYDNIEKMVRCFLHVLMILLNVVDVCFGVVLCFKVGIAIAIAHIIKKDRFKMAAGVSTS